MDLLKLSSLGFKIWGDQPWWNAVSQQKRIYMTFRGGAPSTVRLLMFYLPTLEDFNYAQRGELHKANLEKMFSIELSPNDFILFIENLLPTLKDHN